MADLPESNEWTPGIYQFETSDPVLGGPEGIDNLQGKQLASRTKWLKDQVEKVISGATAIGKAVKLATARTISVSGAAMGSTSFDGSANAAIALTLADSGAVAGTYAKVTINAKGLVVAGSSMVAADIPALDWNKITTGKPTTLAGYGITDSVKAGDKAGQTEAEAGTDDSKWMTALGVFRAITKVVGQATESVFGWARVATQVQLNAGVDDTTIITPKKIKAGFSVLLEGSGYIALPSWLGGWILQWVNGGAVASIPSGGNSSKTLTWPLAWPIGPLIPWVTCTGATPTEVGMVATTSGMSQANIIGNVYNPTTTAKSVQSLIAFGIGR